MKVLSKKFQINVFSCGREVFLFLLIVLTYIKVHCQQTYSIGPFGGVISEMNGHSPQFPMKTGPKITGIQSIQTPLHSQQITHTTTTTNFNWPKNDVEEAERELTILHYGTDENWYYHTQLFRNSFAVLCRMNPDSFSLTKAIFLVENAYLDNQLTYNQYLNAICKRVDLVRQICKREGLSSQDDLSVNYAIQKLYSVQNSYYDSTTKQSYLIKPFSYDFEDIMGKKDLKKTFVTKLLATGKGQCHSLPLLYKIIAEQLGTQAYMALSPQHMYIKFEGRHGTLYNFETTNGRIVSDSWINQSGFITAKAIQQHIYTDTLSHRKLFAQVLDDFLLSYLDRFGYDKFAKEIEQKILQVDPNNLRALMVASNIKLNMAIYQWKKAGSPKMETIKQYPSAYNVYLEYAAANEKIENLGYQDMPEQAYQYWLKSMEDAKVKQRNLDQQQRYEREIHELNKIKMKSPNL